MKKLLSKVVFSLWKWYKSHAVTYSFSSVCKKLGEIFFHTYSQACSIPFVLCEISTKGLESRLEKSAATSPWEKGSPGASMPAEPAVPHSSSLLLSSRLTDQGHRADCDPCLGMGKPSLWGMQLVRSSTASPIYPRIRCEKVPAVSLGVRILYALTPCRFIHEFLVTGLISSRRVWLHPDCDMGLPTEPTLFDLLYKL